MSCKIYRELLHSYINYELNAFEADAVGKHLETCIDCQREVLEIKKLKAVTKTIEPDKIQLSYLKENIMSAIMAPKKVLAAAYDIKVLGRLGASLIACGMLVLIMNFTSPIVMKYDVNQHIAVLNKGLQSLSSKIINLDGITLRIEQKIRGGMKDEM